MKLIVTRPYIVTSTHRTEADINCCSNRIRFTQYPMGYLVFGCCCCCGAWVDSHLNALFATIPFCVADCSLLGISMRNSSSLSIILLCAVACLPSFLPLFLCSHRHHFHHRYLMFFIRFFFLLLYRSVCASQTQTQTKPHCACECEKWMWLYLSV